MKQTTPISDAAVNFIAAAPTRSYAPEVLDAAKMALVDWFGGDKVDGSVADGGGLFHGVSS